MREGANTVLKKILPILFLAGLVIWGIYDYTQNHSGSDIQKQAEQNTESSGEQDPGDRQTVEETTVEKDIGIGEGHTAPDFTLENLKGEPVKLSDLRGKKVILNFWASWCPPCQVEAPEMQAYYEAHKSNDFTILAVNATISEKSNSDVKDFVDDFGLTFPTVLDTVGTISKDYQVRGLPTSYFIDKQGVIHHKIVGPLNQNLMDELLRDME